MKNSSSLVLAFVLFCSVSLKAQGISKVRVSDMGNGNYKNPVLFADYSDPDVCRVGKEVVGSR